MRGLDGGWPHNYKLGHYPRRGTKRHVSKTNAARQAIFPLAKMKQEESMSHLLEIPDELYTALQAAAEASGTTPLERIAAHLPPATEPAGTHDAPAGAPKTLADLFTGPVGRIRS